jgi:hypothetical protein
MRDPTPRGRDLNVGSRQELDPTYEHVSFARGHRVRALLRSSFGGTDASAQIPDDPRRSCNWRLAGGISANVCVGLPPRHDLAGSTGPRHQPEREGPGRRVGATWVHPGAESDGGSPRRHGRGGEAAAIVCGIEGARRRCHRLPRLSRRARRQGNENSDRRGLRRRGPGRDRAGLEPGASGRQHHRHFRRGFDAHDRCSRRSRPGSAGLRCCGTRTIAE